MTSKETKKHTKHAKLTKPLGGDFHRQEWGLIGAPCQVISQLASDLRQKLQPHYKIGFLDAAHNDTGYTDQYDNLFTDNISYQSISFNRKPAPKEYRRYFADLNVLIVNGNHFVADRQIVLLDERKKESLSRKLNRLSNVSLILRQTEDQEIYDFLKPVISDEVPILNLEETDKIAEFMIKDMLIPDVFGLVLAGGKSERMGSDKSKLEYYGKPHAHYTAELIQAHCNQVFLSYRPDQPVKDIEGFGIMKDTFLGLGPYGAILSAFKEFPNKAWLTVACDLPFLDQTSINYLFEHRNPNKLATCFHNNETNFPEPLITIWEPKAYPVLLEYLGQAYSCPRKVLINSEVEKLNLDNQQVLSNANNKAAYLDAIHTISKK